MDIFIPTVNGQKSYYLFVMKINYAVYMYVSKFVNVYVCMYL